ncbi:hypothetical protein WJX72_008871 [[Myrmecia] bisecta]|uniref:Uncharacterized protein n=1 Tax=[Myrmecia] bisecta TaxID=41462 RepID=A0AAW1R8J3_9CHLO
MRRRLQIFQYLWRHCSKPRTKQPASSCKASQSTQDHAAHRAQMGELYSQGCGKQPMSMPTPWQPELAPQSSNPWPMHQGGHQPPPPPQLAGSSIEPSETCRIRCQCGLPGLRGTATNLYSSC